MLHQVLPDNDLEVVAALRNLIAMCLRSDPAMRPSITILPGMDELRMLSKASHVKLDDMPEPDSLSEISTEESADIVSALIRNLVDRFDFTQTGCLDKWELDLVRDRLHRSLEEKDVRSLELMGCWLDFQRGCPEADLTTPDDATGRTLLHAVAQSDRAEELMALVEDYCEEAYPGHSDVPLSPCLAVRDREGHTPLWLAAAMGASPTFCVRLLELGADVNASDDAGVTCLQRCLAPGYQKPGEQRADVVTVLRGFGARLPDGIYEQPPHLTKQLMAAARTSMSDARKVVSKLQTRLNEMRHQRKLTQMSKEAPPLPLPFDANAPEPLALDNGEDAPKQTPPLRNTPKMDTRFPTSVRCQDSGSKEVSTDIPRISIEPPVIAESEVTASPEQSITPAPLASTPAPDSATEHRPVGNKSGQRPPPMPVRTSRGAPDASPVAPRVLFQAHSRASPSASASPSPRSPRAQAPEAPASDLHTDTRAVMQGIEKRLRQHLLKLGANHVQAAFRYADKDGDNHVGREDVRHLLETLELSEGEEASACLRYFGRGRGMGIKGFAAWLRGKVNAADVCGDIEKSPEQAMRRSSSQRPNWTSRDWTRSTRSSHGTRARSTDGFPGKSSAMPAILPRKSFENGANDRLISPDPISERCGPGIPPGELEPQVRRLSRELASSVSPLPLLSKGRSHSPLDTVLFEGRCRSRDSARCSSRGRRPRSGNVSSLRHSSLGGRSHDAAA